MGWDLNVPGVSRKTSKGIPRYLDKEDIFLISGSEDLVPIGAAGGPARYRPRTEGIFARIQHHDGPGTNHWQVRSQDGLVSFYGTPERPDDDPAVVADPGDGEKIFEWKLSATEDSFGNSILYEYERDTGDTKNTIGTNLKADQVRDYLDSQATKQFLVSLTFSLRSGGSVLSIDPFEIRTRKRARNRDSNSRRSHRLVRSYQLIYLDQRGIALEHYSNAVCYSARSWSKTRRRGDQRLPALEFAIQISTGGSPLPAAVGGEQFLAATLAGKRRVRSG